MSRFVTSFLQNISYDLIMMVYDAFLSQLYSCMYIRNKCFSIPGLAGHSIPWFWDWKYRWDSGSLDCNP